MAETTTAAPPATAPAYAPSTPPPAAPPSTSPPSTTSAPASEKKTWLDEVGQDFETLDKKGDGKPPEVKPPETKAEDGKQPEAKPSVEEPAAKPIKTAALRDAYETLKKEKTEVLQPKIQQLESRLNELESQGGETLKPLQEKMAAIEKRNAELEAHITFADYQQSTEFKTKFKEPYAEAWNRASADFGQLTVRVPDGTDENGEPKFATRAATDNDLLYLANLPLSQMDEQAEALFGRSAARVIRHVERVRELAEAQNKAIADAQKRSGEMVKSRQLQMQEHRQTQQKLWTDFNKQIAERFPEMFGPHDGDQEGNTLLEKGFAEADRIFAPDSKGKPQTPEERLQAHVRARNKIANHDRLARQVKTLRAELEEARKSLDQYEHSGPPTTRTGTPASPPKSFTAEVEAELDKMDKQGG